MSSRERQPIGEFCLELDRQTRRHFGMDVEQFKILKNLGLALIIAYVGLETGTSFHYIVVTILAVAAPDALELFLGNGLANRLSSSNSEDKNE